MTKQADSAGVLDRFFAEAGLAFKREVAAFAASLDLDARAGERDGCFPRKAWEACAAYGIQGTAVPQSLGGGGGDIVRAVLAMEGFGLGCRDNGLAFALSCQMWTTQLPILEFGSEAQKRRYLPAMCAGQLIAAQAMTERDAGSDAYALQTRAVRDDGGYVLDGEKLYVSLGPVADLFLVFATLDEQAGRWGVTAFLVERGTSGLEVSPAQEKMGLRTTPWGTLRLDGCRVPDAARLGPERAGAAISAASLEWERSCMLATHLGQMEHQLGAAVREARARKQFGQPIGRFQSVSNRVAEMKLRLEAGRLLVYRVAALKAQGRSAPLEAALAKLWIGESLLESSLDSLRIHGGRGYLTETEVERDVRDAVGGVLWGGTSDIQRVIVARLLGL